MQIYYTVGDNNPCLKIKPETPFEEQVLDNFDDGRIKVYFDGDYTMIVAPKGTKLRGDDESTDMR